MNSKKYNNIKLAVGILKGAAGFILLFLFVWLGFSSMLTSWISDFTDNNYLILLAFVFISGISASVISFPLSYYSSFYLEHKFKLSNQTFLKWIWESLKGVFLSIIIGIPLLFLFYFTLQQFDSLWWLPFAIIVFLFSVVLAKIFPVFILPLFYKMTPLNDDKLKERITRLSSEAGVAVENIFRFNMSKNTKKANAVFTGIGKTKRILLGDTLLENYSDDEIETIVAHELGHYKKKHIIKNIFTGTVFSFLTLYLISLLYQKSLPFFGFTQITEIAALPILSLWAALIGLIQTPLTNMLSRKYEYEADKYAVLSTSNPSAFISALEKLTEQNLADKLPHPFIEWFFYSHPSMSKRIESINKTVNEGTISLVTSSGKELS
ncbi:MAG: M48 family metallopeptidase [Ignavibacteriaceae bacterium]|nr:M48 family metallopeptidase [Ignavibacteriaceae bacterium]